jgi:hypothetical protein
MGVIRTLAILIFLSLSISARVSAGPLRIALLSTAAVQNDTILLANLLPLHASQSIRTAAQEISLGSAPQFGSERQFASATVADAIATAGLSPGQFDIPPTITVRRENQFISSREILAAIQSALPSAEAPNLANLQPADLLLDAAVPVPPGYAGLEVTQMAFDSALDRMRFRVLPKAPGRVLPFYVTARLPETFSGFGSVRSPVRQISAASDQVHASQGAPAAPLVIAGHPARLHLHSANMDMLLAVNPLQRGYLDQVIRVRLSGSGKTMQARVVAAGYLDATL